MKMHAAGELQPLNAPLALLQPRGSGATPEQASQAIYQQMGCIRQLLHSAVTQLQTMPKPQVATDVVKDGLNAVDSTKQDHAVIASATKAIAREIVQDPVKAVASGAVHNFVREVQARSVQIDGHLTHILAAQNRQELTCLAVTRAVTEAAALTQELESNLVKLLAQGAPPEQR